MRALAPNLRAVLVDTGDSQRNLAAFVQDWLARHDLEAELDRLVARRNRPADEKERLLAVVAVVRDALRRRAAEQAEAAARQGDSQVFDDGGPSPAAVSKWLQDVYLPTERFWLPLAIYMRLPLWELYDLLRTEVPDRTEVPVPKSVAGLQARLADTEAKLASAETEATTLDAEVRRLAGANVRLEATLAAQERRIAQLEAAEVRQVAAAV